MINGWLNQGLAPARIRVIEPNPSPATKKMLDTAGVKISAQLDLLPKTFVPRIVVLAVKPQMLADVAPAYKIFADALFVSVAAGKNLAFLSDLLGQQAAIVRAMPNTPAAIGQGMTALIGNSPVVANQKTQAEQLMQAVGQVLWLESESQMDAVTALSGSGPAYVFALIEAMIAGGERVGLPADLARKLVLATVAGAGQLAAMSDQSPTELRQSVTSPNGTTQAALDILLAEPGLQDLMRRSIHAAAERSKQLAR